MFLDLLTEHVDQVTAAAILINDKLASEHEHRLQERFDKWLLIPLWLHDLVELAQLQDSGRVVQVLSEDLVLVLDKALGRAD